MRAKQQQHAAMSPPGGAAVPFAPFQGKSEPGGSTDTVDSTSASNDSVAAPRNAPEGATRCNSDQVMSQWLFPQFEAVPMMVAPSESSSVKLECQSPVVRTQRGHIPGCGGDSRGGGDSPSRAWADLRQSTNQMKSDSLCETQEDKENLHKARSGNVENGSSDLSDVDSQRSGELNDKKGVVKAEYPVVSEEGCKRDTHDASEHLIIAIDAGLNRDRPAINRRKRAKPQWVYEGTQLERLHGAPDTPSGGRLDGENGEDDRLDAYEKSDRKSDDSSSGRDIIQKMQQCIQASDIHWEEMDRHENIDRIQSSIHTHSYDEWEF